MLRRRGSVELDPALVAAATPVDLEAAESADVEVLAWLDPLVDGRRLAFVGEADHFVHEKTGYRLLLIRYLISRGFTVLAEELAWSDGVRLDRYVQTGDESWLDLVTTFGYRGDERDDRDDRATGILCDGETGYPSDAFRAEHTRLLRAVRELERPPRLYGFDVDYVPSAGYRHLAEELGALEIAPPEREAIAATAARVDGESLDDEIARLACLLDIVTERAPALAGTVRTLLDGHRYIAMAHPAPDYESLRPAMAFRERAMHAHVDRILESEGPDARVVLFAHNLHLAKHSERIATPSSSVGPGGDQVPPLGSHLVQRWGADSIAAFWLLHHEGTSAQPIAALPSDLRPRPGSLNDALASVGESIVVPAATLTEPCDVVMMYGHTVRAAPAEQTDAIVFCRRCSPLRTTP